MTHNEAVFEKAVNWFGVFKEGARGKANIVRCHVQEMLWYLQEYLKPKFRKQARGVSVQMQVLRGRLIPNADTDFYPSSGNP